MKRNIFKVLEDWKDSKNRKPLLLRGARQVGKTYAVNQLASDQFEKFISLNLEKDTERRIFREVKGAKELLKDLEIYFQQEIVVGKTLIFIDEIQASENAMHQLRFFYEEVPELHVIAAGSLLELKLKEKSFEIPVGRIDYKFMFPLNFDEFLEALDYKQSLAILDEVSLGSDLSEVAHEKLLEQYREFSLVGGMPEAVNSYRSSRQYLKLSNIYSSIVNGFLDDVYKYSSGNVSEQLSFIIENSPRFVGTNITYNKFAGSQYSSQSISSAFKTLEQALLLKLVRPTNSIDKPLTANFKASPKLIFLDQGLVNSIAKISSEYASGASLNDLYRGQVAEQVVGQTLWQQSVEQNFTLHYWARFKPGSQAEIDFLVDLNGNLIPLEVKSGPLGKLRSLQEFMNRSDSKIAVKITSSPLRVETVKSMKGKKFQLLNIPHYLVHRLHAIV